MVYYRAYKSFIIALVGVAIPTLLILIYIDSIYYGSYTFVVYNFVYKNLVENISATFGVSPPLTYITNTLPYNLNATLLPFVIGIYFELNKKIDS
jgi:hypothetical protein